MIVHSQFLEDALAIRKKDQALRSLLPADESMIDFCSNDYLGFTRSPVLLEKVETEWLRLKSLGEKQLLGAGGSRLLAGDSVYAHELENELAVFYGSESGLLFNSGYAANTGILASVPQRGDTILYDELVHASMRDGIRLSHATAWSFAHNDLDHLEALLRKAQGRIFVAVEAFYSMDGDEVPLTELVGLCEKYQAAIILDEAHSNGLYGEHGEGIAFGQKLHSRIFARILTFGKAAGSHGAFVAGSALLREYLINFARPFIYSTALPLHDLAVIRESVRLFPAAIQERAHIFDLANFFRSKIENKHLLLPALGPIQALVIPGNDSVRSIAQKCRAEKLDVRPVLSPTVGQGKERLRIILHAYNTKSEVEKLLSVCNN
jgi:8-amino-7-oxononanoate synthase